MQTGFDKLCESYSSKKLKEKNKGLWHNIRKKRGNPSSKWKNDPKYRKQMKDQAKKIAAKEGVHDPVRPGILKRQVKGKVTCSKARTLKGKQKNKSNNTAKAAQRFLNYHCEETKKATCCGRCGRVHVKGTKCKRPYLKGKDHCRNN